MPRIFRIVCLLIACSTLAHSQTEAQPPAVLTFTVDFPTSQPERYSIRVQSDGPAHYESSGRISSESDDTDNFDLDFTVASGMRQKVFDLAARAGYFQKDIDSHHKGLAFTGKKMLSYKSAQRVGESTYNYSSNSAVQELTALFQGLSATLEYGHRLRHDHQYQKLALDEELKRMGDLDRSNQLVEVRAIQSILEQIIADPSVINVTRARAQRLLDGAAIH
jgi:hypothetical protein